MRPSITPPDSSDLLPPVVATIEVAIPVFNRFEHLEPLLNQFSQQTALPRRVTIVDHGTKSLSLEQKWPFPVDVIKRDSSLWFTEAINEGLAHIAAHDPDYILIANDDVKIGETNWLERLLEVAREPETIAASAAVDEDGLVLYAGVKLDAARGKYRMVEKNRKYSEIDKSTVQCDVLPTRGILFPAKTLERVGYLNEMLLPHHGSDYEWTARARQQGFSLAMVRNVHVITARETPPENSRISLRAKLVDYFTNEKHKGSFRVVRNYSKLVFKNPYRSYFVLSHCFRFLLSCAKNQVLRIFR